jgi:thiamine-phosphate diphosphorylase
MSLPSHYLITPSPEDEDAFLAALERSLQAGARLMQLKGKGMEPQAYAALARKVIAMAHAHDCRVLLTGDPALVERLGADGLHLDSKALKGATTRPLPDGYLVAVSGHHLAALRRGEAIGASLAVLSPVNYTKAHPDIEPLGWEGFAEIVSQLRMPVYALGGVSAEDEAAAIAAGGQGVAGNKGYWKG